MRLPPMTATRRVLACMGLPLIRFVSLTIVRGRGARARPNEGQITISGLRVTPLVTFGGMSDRYQSLIHTPVGQLLAKNLGLPNPVDLERWSDGDPLVQGTVVVGGEGRLGSTLTTALDDL